MPTYLEHANITVPDIPAAIAFLRLIDPDFVVRHDETPEGSSRWTHVGTDDFYVALQEPYIGATPEIAREAYVNFGVNHLAWVVDDFDAVIARLEAAGCRQGIDVARHPHRKRAYYFDSAGQEWEIVQYLSADPARRNDYA
jgi:catechol 2,3-dioxygenase-like lactoylglutathione lyase family enzyme